MKFLNGWKTILGVAGIVLPMVIAPEKAHDVITHADSIVVGAAGLLTILGVIHKTEKASAAKAAKDAE